MEKSNVFYSDMHVRDGQNLLTKLQKLIIKAGIENIDFKNKFAAIKIHFGEPGNLSFLRPNYAKALVEVIKKNGGIPFLTDCNTLYVGRRKNAIDHLEAAAENGFSPASCGCQIIIADGLKGTDELSVHVDGGELVKDAKIGRAVMDADIIISLNHFKGHEAVGFGGALKNLGMGCGSRAGKMEQHCCGKPDINKDKCVGCKMCFNNCAHGAISYENKKALIDHKKCVGCGRCLGACNFDAIYNENDSALDDLNKKISEYAKAAINNRPQFHINLVIDVSPYCDCHAENDIPIIPNVGMFASFDAVALDKACADMCNKQNAVSGSILDKNLQKHGDEHKDCFKNIFPTTDWKVGLVHAEKIGIGTMNYELIEVK